MRFRSTIGRFLQELLIYRYLFRGRKPRVAFFTGGKDDGMSSGLRGHQVAKILGQIGWSTVLIPHQISVSQAKRLVGFLKPDLLYFQMNRHSCHDGDLYPGVPYVYDVDDADYLDAKFEQSVNKMASNAGLIIAGSETILNHLSNYNSSVFRLWTPVAVIDSVLEIKRSEIVSLVWACSSPDKYLAEARLLKEVIAALSKVCSCFCLEIIGNADADWIENYMQSIRVFGIQVRHVPFVPYEQFVPVLAKHDIGLAPLCPDESAFSSGKSFGKILGYLNAELPVVASDAADHALAFDGTNGAVVDGVDQWVAVLKRLVEHPEDRIAMGKKGKAFLREHMAIEKVGRRYHELMVPLLPEAKRSAF